MGVERRPWKRRRVDRGLWNGSDPLRRIDFFIQFDLHDRMYGIPMLRERRNCSWEWRKDFATHWWRTIFTGHKPYSSKFERCFHVIYNERMGCWQFVYHNSDNGRYHLERWH